MVALLELFTFILDNRKRFILYILNYNYLLQLCLQGE